MIKKIALGVFVYCGVSVMTFETVDGMFDNSINGEVVDKDQGNVKSKRSFSLPITKKELEIVLGKLGEPTPKTREKLKKYSDFFVEDDKYPMPSRLWNWSVESDANMAKSLKVGKIIKSSSVPSDHDEIFDRFENFYTADDNEAEKIATEFVDKCQKRVAMFEDNSAGAVMQRLYQIADDLYISETVQEAAWRLYEKMYVQMMGIQ